MRENLFRGKRRDNGEWVYGSLFVGFKKSYICPEAIAMYYFAGALGLGGFIEVDPSTVGQYVLNDNNGKMIFEGDIIKADNGKQSDISVVKFGEYYPKMFYAMLDMFNPGIPHLNANGFYLASTKHEDMILFKSRHFEIIGNIHDNKSLLNNQEAGE